MSIDFFLKGQGLPAEELRLRVQDMVAHSPLRLPGWRESAVAGPPEQWQLPCLGRHDDPRANRLHLDLHDDRLHRLRSVVRLAEQGQGQEVGADRGRDAWPTR